MQVNIADQPYCATIQPTTGPSRNVPIEPTPEINNMIHTSVELITVFLTFLYRLIVILNFEINKKLPTIATLN